MIFIFALLGIAVGSFLNVCIDRLPERQSLMKPPSHCPACQRRLGFRDLIPLVSYLWLRGRCRTCGASIPRRLFWVELGTGLMLALLWWGYGPSILAGVYQDAIELGVLTFFGCLFIVISVIDLEHRLILNRVVYPTALITLALVFLRPEVILNNLDLLHLEPTIINSLINSLIGGGIGLAFLLIPAIISRGGMGWGDVKLAGLVGLMTGFPTVFVTLLLAVVSGGLIGSILLLLSIKKRKDAIPFGPYICLGTAVALIWGIEIIAWYLQLFA